MMVDLNDYYSAGYFLIRANNPGWSQLKSEFLPDRFISVSTCFCPRFRISWGWVTGNKQSALDFGIPADKLKDFEAWSGSDYKADMDIWSMFHSTAAARRSIRRFLPDTAGLCIIGAGLPRELEESNWRESHEEEAYGIEKRIEHHLPMETNGEVLGFEVISFEYNDFGHSWLCNYLHEEMYRLFDVCPNHYGLLGQHDDAKKIYEWIAEDEMKGTRAEPAPYDFWLLVSYPLDVEESD